MICTRLCKTVDMQRKGQKQETRDALTHVFQICSDPIFYFVYFPIPDTRDLVDHVQKILNLKKKMEARYPLSTKATTEFCCRAEIGSASLELYTH